MEKKSFTISTEFIKHKDTHHWYIENVKGLKHIEKLYSPVFNITKLTFNWAYKMILCCAGEALSLELKSEDKLSYNKCLCIEVIIWNDEKKEVIWKKKLEESLKENSIYKVFSHDSIIIECNIVCNIPKSTIISNNYQLLKETEPWKHLMNKHLSELYLNPEFSDITFYVEDSVLPAHKIILATHSEVFRRMFTSQMKEQKERKVYISNFTAEIFNCMLCYIYTGVLTDLKSLVNELIFIAHMYDIKALIRKCIYFLVDNMNNENVLDTLLIAVQLNLNDLEESCMKYIIANKKSIVSKKEFDDIKNHLDIAMKLLDLSIDYCND